MDILLVEDNPADVRLAREAMKESGFEATLHVAPDGEAALVYLQSRNGSIHRPALILLDLNLPKRDGREVLSFIKSDPSLRRIPVVVLTTSSAERDVQEAYDRHANCYLTKPADLDRYVETFRLLGQFWLKTARLPG